MKTYKANPREIFVMRASQSVELGPSYVRGIMSIQRSAYKKLLVCEGFKVANFFQNNIVLLTGNRAMYCTDFKEEESEAEGEKGMSRFFLHGFLFETVKDVWDEPCSSARIGLFHVSRLDLSQIVIVSAMDLVSKCFFSVRGHGPGKKPAKDPIPGGNCSVIFRQYQESRDETIRQGHLDRFYAEALHHRLMNPEYVKEYWWIWSIVQPGHFPNYFQ